MTFGCKPVTKHKEYYKVEGGGEGWWLPPSPGRNESCESVFARVSSMHQKCSNYALTNLLLVCVGPCE
jgi:hypothetical protein